MKRSQAPRPSVQAALLSDDAEIETGEEWLEVEADDELAALAAKHEQELATLREEHTTRLQAVERERDQAQREVRELREELARMRSLPTLQPVSEPAPSVHEVAAPSEHAQRGNLPQQALHSPHQHQPSGARREVTGSPGVPVLSDVSISTDSTAPDAPPSSRSNGDRRTDPRVRRRIELEFNYETHFFAGLSLDISTGGLFVATYHLLPVGKMLWLSFQLPDGTDVHVQGEVRWVRSSADEGERPGMGIAFRSLDEGTLAKISDFCVQRPPLYVEDV